MEKTKRYRGLANDTYDVLVKSNVGMTSAAIAEELPRVGEVRQVTNALNDLRRRGLAVKVKGLWTYVAVQANESPSQISSFQESSPTKVPSILEDIAFIVKDYQKLLVEHKKLKEDFDALHQQYCNIRSTMNGVKKLQVQLGRR